MDGWNSKVLRFQPWAFVRCGIETNIVSVSGTATNLLKHFSHFLVRFGQKHWKTIMVCGKCNIFVTFLNAVLQVAMIICEHSKLRQNFITSQ